MLFKISEAGIYDSHKLLSTIWVSAPTANEALQIAERTYAAIMKTTQDQV